jgi:hypothetical protein
MYIWEEVCLHLSICWCCALAFSSSSPLANGMVLGYFCLGVCRTPFCIRDQSRDGDASHADPRPLKSTYTISPLRRLESRQLVDPVGQWTLSHTNRITQSPATIEQPYSGNNTMTMDSRATIHLSSRSPGKLRQTPFPALDMLKQQPMLSALFNSAERTHALRCHPDTRVAVFEDITHWLHYSSHERPLLVIAGTAGTGNTTVMQTLAEKLYPQGQLVATCFVTPTQSDNSTVDHKHLTVKSDSSGHSKLVSTLASQIASRYLTIRPFILGAVEGNPAIFSTCLNFQLEELIRGPVTAPHTVLHDSTTALWWMGSTSVDPTRIRPRSFACSRTFHRIPTSLSVRWSRSIRVSYSTHIERSPVQRRLSSRAEYILRS